MEDLAQAAPGGGSGGLRRELRADLAIIGAGSGGLTIASGAAQLGLKVVLFERGEMGGDCLNVGCVPSKALIAAAHRAHAARTGKALGVSAGEVRVDFARVMAHVRGTIAAIAPVDSQERFEGLGLTVIRENAAFAGPRAIESDSTRVAFARAVVATGTRPTVPDMPGLADVAYLTNETVFGLDILPERLLVLGGGPIGLELAQAFQRLGSAVTVIEPHRILAREEPAAADLIRLVLTREGVEVCEGAQLVRVARSATGLDAVLSKDGAERTISATHLLVAVGRTPNLEGLHLQVAGVQSNARGIETNAQLRTANRRVFAVGDIAGRGAFTHLAGAHGGLFIRHALFAAPIDADALVVPRATYLDPEVAAVGLTEAEARKAHGDKVRVIDAALADNDRARTEGVGEGFGRLVLGPRNKVLGVTLVGPHAGELIGLWSLALSAKLPLSKVAGMVAPYPTLGEISKRLAGGAFTEALFAPRTKQLVSLLKRVR